MPATIVGCERPRIGFENVLSFPLVEFFLGRQIGNEVTLLIGGQRPIALSLQEETHRTPRFLSSRLVSASTASSTRPTASSSRSIECSTPSTFFLSWARGRSSTTSWSVLVLGTSAYTNSQP